MSGGGKGASPVQHLSDQSVGCRGRRNQKLRLWKFLLDHLHDFEKVRPIRFDFAAARTGDDADDGWGIGKMRTRRARAIGGQLIEERMADEGGGDAAGSEIFLLEGEDAGDVVDVSAELFDAAFAAGPELGGDVVED